MLFPFSIQKTIEARRSNRIFKPLAVEAKVMN